MKLSKFSFIESDITEIGSSKNIPVFVERILFKDKKDKPKTISIKPNELLVIKGNKSYVRKRR